MMKVTYCHHQFHSLYNHIYILATYSEAGWMLSKVPKRSAIDDDMLSRQLGDDLGH
jgi:hypothetical protein